MIRRFGLFWWDFVVGDDWQIAAGVVLALAVTYALAHNGVPAWWFLPIVVCGLAAWSIRKATRRGP